MSENAPEITNIYEWLGVNKDSSAEFIHQHFLKLIRRLLSHHKADPQQNLHLLELQRLWIAHDILLDPDTRAEYDRHAATSTNPTISISQTTAVPEYRAWRIGELLMAAGLIEEKELTIACDMHKAMPEIQFGRFLVQQGLISQKQLKAALNGQKAIRAGKMTLSQFLDTMSSIPKL